MPLYTPPGGWCISPGGNAAGIAPWMLDTGSARFTAVLGGILATLLGPKGVSAGQVQSAMTQTIAANRPYMDTERAEIVELFTAVFTPQSYVITATVHATTAVGQAVGRVVHTHIPAAVDYSTAYTGAVNAATVAWAQGQYQDVYANLEGLAAADLATARNYTGAVNAATVAWAQQGFNATYADLEGYIHSVTALQAERDAGIVTWTQHGFDTVYADMETLNRQLATELQQTQTWAQTQIDQTRAQAATDAQIAYQDSIQYADQTTQGALQPVWAGTAAGANAARQGIQQLSPTTTATLQEIPTSTPLTPALALAGLAAAVKTLTRVATTCSEPNCAQKNTLGRGLKAVDTLLAEGALLAFVAAAIADPTPTASDSWDVLGSIIDGVATAVKALVP